VDVDYTFAQVGIEEDAIGYEGNCGNISAGVGPFAIDEGLIKGPFRKGSSADPELLAMEVRIYQTGTKKVLIAYVPIDEKTGRSVSRGALLLQAYRDQEPRFLWIFETLVLFEYAMMMALLNRGYNIAE
jgi:2-methylaconitate cis-trans-isomerase PrpF